MGCFDSVTARCPQCGAKSEFQSKGGECLMQHYELSEAPSDVLSDVNRHSPNTCQKCGVQFGIALKTIRERVVIERLTASPVVWPNGVPPDEVDPLAE